MQLHRAREKFSATGFQVILVGLGSTEQARQFRKDFAPFLPIICDPERDLYRLYGLGRGSVSGMASPGVILKGLQSLSRGYMPGLPRGDVMQLPGVFLIDTEGNIRYAHYAKDPSDHPSVETLLKLTSSFS